MAYITTVRPRLTHRYVGTYRHLDKWGSPIYIKMVVRRRIEAWELAHMKGRNPDSVDISDGPRTILYARAPRKAQPADVMRALHDEYSAHGCSHEWDCCGCPSYRADVVRVGRRDYKITIDTSYNY